MKNTLLNLMLFLFSGLLVACNNSNQLGSDEFSKYEDEPIQILSKEQLLRKVNEIEVRANDAGQEDIFITAFDGTFANFISYDACAGKGSSYNLIGGIPNLGVIFIDRTNGCHMGETTLMVSLKDGTQRELQSFGIYNENQFQLSPEKSWLILSSCDCSFGFETSCTMEILSLSNRNSSLLKSAFFEEGVCACNSITWNSENEFETTYAIGEGDDFECEYGDLRMKFENDRWGVFY
jgi:hypothetical protein